MSIVMSVPNIGELGEAIGVLRQWQSDDSSVQLHPGDLGWHWRFGAEVTAQAVRIWSRDGTILALGLLDGPRLIRLAIAPDADQDEELAGQMSADLARPERGVLPSGGVCVEARWDGVFRELLLHTGWQLDEPWTPLRRDLTQPVPDCGMRIETVGPERVQVRVAVHRAAFDRTTFTDQRWYAMAAGTAYPHARCLVGYDEQGAAVAAVTVWSAGPGRPGLLEPMGVHRDHRGHGHGTGITVAAAAALREMGSSSAIVCTPSSNVGAVATYRSAGFRQLPEVPDLRRVLTSTDVE